VHCGTPTRQTIWRPYMANNVRDSETRNEKRAALYKVLTKDLGKKYSAELQWGK
jgi:hypothetical protein